MSMLELTLENTAAYLRSQGWIDAEPVHVEMLAGGVSNQVLRVTTPASRIVLKQSRPQLRTRDTWFSDLDRIWREQEVMQALYPHLPDVVPKVLHVDRPNYVYTMSHAPLDARVWKAELLAGTIDVQLARRVGEVLGRIHQISAGFRQFADHTAYVQLRVDPFYRRVQERCPDVADAIAPIVADMLTRKEALCHGDYTPKNILVHDAGFMLVDYETAHFGDPSMDLGLFLAHLTLKAVRDQPRTAQYLELMRAFWSGYRAVIGLPDIERRGVQHLGACLLARVDGTSPVDYLGDEQKAIVRKLGHAILLGGMSRWEEVWQWLLQSSDGSCSGLNSTRS